MNSPVISEHRRLRRELGRRADRSQGRFLRQYLGSPLPVLGVRAPEIRKLLRESRARLRALSPSARLALARSLWNGRTFEERLLAVALLDQFLPAGEPRAWRLLDRWVDAATGWALSDSLAAGPIARSLAQDGRHFAEILRWTRSRSFWRRRASTYALHDWVFAGKLDRPFRLLERLVADPEFWVQRAVGTWLRECWKQNPRRTERFLLRHARVLAPVTVSVATKRAPKELLLELRRVRAAGRGRASGQAY
ncbi:MAG: DNA alkylation repair protein [Thermoplasmata archaeon]|jgi:3-methyladenine DNA glycosylase AlkD